MTSNILFGKEARDAIQTGVDKVCNSVKVTLGAAGRNVVIAYPHGNLSTRDGVTVAKSIYLPNPIEKAGAEIIKEVATKMLTEVGDATTTACVLAQAIVTEGMKLVEAGANPVELKKGIDKAVEAVVARLKEISIDCTTHEQMLQVATVSANHDAEIGSLVAEAFSKVGGDGVVLIEDSVNRKTVVKMVDGLQFDKGYGIAEFFVTDRAKMVAEMKDTYVLIFDGVINTMKEIQPIMQTVLGKMAGKLMIIANGIENEAYAFLGVNRSQQGIPVIMVEAPGYGQDRTEILEDIAVLTGGQMISEAKGFKLETITMEVLGKCERVTVSKNSTTIVGGAGTKKDISDRVEELKVLLEDCTEELAQGFIRRRIAKLTGAVAILSVGAGSDVELREKKDRCDDAIRATKSAIEEGIVAGGGISYIRCLSAVSGIRSPENEGFVNQGISLIYSIMDAPIKQILLNAGKKYEDIYLEITDENLENNFGYNVKTERVEDMIAAGIIDPTKAARCALEFSAGIAGLLLTTETLCINVPEPQQMQ